MKKIISCLLLISFLFFTFSLSGLLQECEMDGSVEQFENTDNSEKEDIGSEIDLHFFHFLINSKCLIDLISIKPNIVFLLFTTIIIDVTTPPPDNAV